MLSFAYEKIWVPILGRTLYIFSSLIEGKRTLEKPTYNIKYTKVNSTNLKN
ncbi:Hypothetical protein P9211_08351 [Prochlorococcus marinus str. MIT 9211]|uniref:Uncharacterized protein n=1 Tax=Prochlorococcus marinus (strain MIT 9211) TaxID=93059 RepID=A9BAA4_PROM4|nr:Hypothetical protein P9211_08351 [Prochlorococcus marinus str. MIT 9211]